MNNNSGDDNLPCKKESGKGSKRKRKSSSKLTDDVELPVLPAVATEERSAAAEKATKDGIEMDEEKTQTDVDCTEGVPAMTSIAAAAAADDDEDERNDDDDVLAVKKKRVRKRKTKRKDEDNNDIDIDAKAVPEKGTTTQATTTDFGATTGKDSDGDNIEARTKTDGSDEIDRTVYMEGIPFHATYDQIVNFLVRPYSTDASVNDGANTNRTNIQQHEIIDIRLPIWQDTGRYRGYGHVVFTSNDIQQFAIQTLQRQYFFVNSNATGNTKSNRYISISQAKAKQVPGIIASTSTVKGVDQDKHNIPTLGEPSKTLILRNVSYQATEEDICNAVENLNVSNTNSSMSFMTPTLESGQIRIVRHTIPPYRSKGLAYITFSTINDATNCIQCIQQASTPFSICQRAITHYDYDHGRIKGSFRTAQHTFWSTTYGNNNHQPQHQRSLKNRMSK